MANTAWMIDMGYVVSASAGKFKLDYLKARQFIQSRFGSVNGFIFNGVDSEYGMPAGLESFYGTMASQGFDVRLQPMESGPPGTNRQRRVDVDLCAHLIWQASLGGIETLVLTTGDQDFLPAVELVRTKMKKRVVLFAYDAKVSKELIASVDEVLTFEDHEKAVSRM